MTTQQLEDLREAVSARIISRENILETVRLALEDCRLALKYEDLSYMQERAQYVADVLKSLIGR